MKSNLCRLLAVAAVTVGLVSDSPAADEKKLNVLFILSDDMRPELGCYGNKQIQSPNIDALAKKGVRFERAYCQYPLCNPSRSSMLTGRQPTVTGVLDNRTWVGAGHPDFVTLPAHFKANGYPALRAGKIFHGGIDDFDAWTEGGEKRTFEGATSDRKPNPNQAANSDRQIVLEGDGEAHGDYKTAIRTIEYLRKYKDKPFFIACGFTKPHSPPTAPKKFFDLYDASKIPLPPDFAAKPTTPEGFPAASVPLRNGDLFIQREASEKEAREMIRAYWASLSFTDWNVGRVIEELDKLGLRDKTVIVFWGDHGYHLGEKGKWSKHASLFEVGTRVPLIVAAPGAKGNGTSSPRIVQSLDIYPTLCELCGVPAPKGLDGHSLKPLLADPAAKWEHPAYSVTGNNNRLGGVAVRVDGYRYVEWDGGKGGALLFDETKDPHEQKNLAGDKALADVRKRLEGLAREQAARWKVPAKLKPVAHRVLAADRGTGKVAILNEKGDVEWEFANKHDVHDLHLLPDGNLLVHVSHTKLVELNRDKKVVWEYESKPKAGYDGKVEVHAFQRLEDGKTLIAESGNRRLIEVDRAGKIVKEVPLEVKNPHHHRDTRMARKLDNGHYLVCHEADGCVREYDDRGKVVWSYTLDLGGRPKSPGHGPEGHGTDVYGAIRLANGNTLIAGGNNNRVLEVDPKGKVVWSIDQKELPGVTLAWVTTLHALPNGNVVIGNCHAGPDQPQLIEVTRDKEVVWTFKDHKTFGNNLASAQILGVEGKVIR